MNSSNSPPLILWRQVGGLATLQGAIALCWMIYRIYLPKLLADFGFPGLEFGIVILEDAIAVVIEPVAGKFSDRQRQWMGTRFPLIALGVIITSGLTIAIPTFFIFGKPFERLRWLFLLMLLSWAMVMALFRSPALSLIAQYAVDTQLPQAMSVLILVGGLAGAFRPVVSDFILSLGPAIPFTVGSFVLLISAAILRSVKPDTALSPSSNSLDSEQSSRQFLGLIILTGMGIAWGTRVLFSEIFPQLLPTQFSGNVKTWMTVIGVVLAFTSLPAGFWASRIGNQKALLIGLITTAGLLLGLTFSKGAIFGSILFLVIASYSFIANGAIPFALSLVPPQQGGFGIGLYFGGFSLAMSLYGVLFGQFAVNLPIKALFGAAAFLMAGMCLKVSERR